MESLFLRLAVVEPRYIPYAIKSRRRNALSLIFNDALHNSLTTTTTFLGSGLYYSKERLPVYFAKTENCNQVSTSLTGWFWTACWANRRSSAGAVTIRRCRELGKLAFDCTSTNSGRTADSKFTFSSHSTALARVYTDRARKQVG